MASVEFSFNKATYEEMRDFILANHPEDKKWFKGEAFEVQPVKVGVDVLGADGKPIFYQVKDKNGNYLFNEDGTPKMRKKKKMVETSETHEVYNHLKAKRAFFGKYAPDKLPKEGKAKKTNKSDDMKDW